MITFSFGKEDLFLPGSGVSIKEALKDSMVIPVSKEAMYDVPLIAVCTAMEQGVSVNDKYNVKSVTQKFKVKELVSGNLEKEFTILYTVFEGKKERQISPDESLLFIMKRDKRDGYNLLLKAFFDKKETRKEIMKTLDNFLISDENTMRAEKPCFKGMELYSWQEKSGEWMFSFLEGTNRNKTYSEITNPSITIKGVENVKIKLAFLAKGESLFWGNVSDGKASLPPDKIIKELADFCKKLYIKLFYNFK